MSKTFNLSYLLDVYGKKRIDLISFSSLEELDDYIISNFVTNLDVRKRYKQVIDPFYEKVKRGNPSKWPGNIDIVYDDNGDIMKIPVMYKDGRKIKDIDTCLSIFKEAIHDKLIMKNLMTEKPDVFSDEEKYYYYKAIYYIDYGVNSDKEKYDDFIERFYKRITKDERMLYYHFRNMMDYFDFSIGSNKERVRVTFVDELKLSKIEHDKLFHELYHGNGEIIKFSKIKTPEREGVEVIDSAPDDFKYAFYKALDTGDFDTLYNMYSLEEIEKYTNLIQGKRK